MKKQWAGTLALCAALGIGAMVGRYSGEPLKLTTGELQKGITLAAQRQKPRYKLAGCDGKLAVYIVGKEQPEIIFDIYLHHLPDVDRLKLDEGVEIVDYQELLTIIEDYTS